MSQYNTGTVSVTNGSAIVIGSGTAWASEVSAGDVFLLVSDSVPYIVQSVSSDTQLVLSSDYAGADATGAAYTIVRDFTTNYNLPYPSKGDIETAAVLRDALLKIDQALGALQPAGLLRYRSSDGVPHFVVLNPLTFRMSDGTERQVYTI